ncbi:hypothetical protein QBC34DRAFT_476948 [Podospora aff. communis PSN243]|uniref:Uncharacterized protein n=1 Tax=Podospora aff. communis PSN243 TaxID=3040156 RepID=A0AAV9G936_9PEZI|nr:hypothetical protein QBC34DRAFT_476948 [Podospora aff. communis PSN243]
MLPTLLLLALIPPSSLAALILPGGTPKPYTGPAGATTPYAFFQSCLSNEPEFLPSPNGSSPATLLLGDRSPLFFSPEEYPGRAILPSTDSFIRGAIQAWSQHLHLAIEPDVVWLTILTQLSFYMRANQEKVKHVFDFAGPGPLEISEFPDWYLIMVTFYGAVTDRVGAEWVYEFIRPYFSTTSDNSIMASHIIMMGWERTEFVVDEVALCGLPSVRLDGELRDWEDILGRLDRFATLGAEVEEYGRRLRPVLERIVESFERPGSEEAKGFWNQVVLAEESGECGGAGLNVSGWITAFSFWDVDGKPYGREKGKFVLDGVAYPSLNIRTLPSGYAKAPFVWKYVNGFEKRNAFAIAGLLGKHVEAGAPAEYVQAMGEMGLNGTYNETQHATLTPLSSWALFDPVIPEAKGARWALEPELASLESSLQVSTNQTQCIPSI